VRALRLVLDPLDRKTPASGLRHVRTRPYTPQTNGQAERFIQTSLREWIYAQPYRPPEERAKAMHPWIDAYNTKRAHSAIKHPGKG
jgi:transposase InsO family protein